MADAAKTNAYHDAAVDLFGELKLQRYAPAGLGVLPVLMADANAYKTNYNDGGQAEVFRDLAGNANFKNSNTS